MSDPTPILEGVIAINKPTAITSAQVIRDFQKHANPSKFFAPWISAEQARRNAESHNQRQKRSRRARQPAQLKVGHGGTLDPLATGVLILGIGSGTKSLQRFLECTKTYETVLLFGAATDTYDVEGKVVKRAPYQHVTREKVEEALATFRGDIMQKPPIFSALRVGGKRLYEYAREGIEVPIEIQERPVRVDEMEILEWPEKEAEAEEKKVADKLLKLDEVVDGDKIGKEHEDAADVARDLKRKRDGDVDGTGVMGPDSLNKKTKTSPEPLMSGALPADATSTQQDSTDSAADDATATASASEPSQPAPPCPAPAARIRMTVTSGFYVRSLCHDLGAAVGSLGLMSSLVRSRQGDFALGKNVLEYSDLEKGEEVWAPQVREMLEAWSEKRVPEENPNSRSETHDKGGKPKPRGRQPANGRERKANTSSPEERERRRRNTSSPED
ncbi:pseudouridine synthase pus4 [Taxawa tesnikishii (nom. ined.)]|nr:pseudouridine synthase pus4 [Dothideales sp. JES 119]